MANGSLGNLSVTIGADTRPLEQGVSRARSELSSVGRTAGVAGKAVAGMAAAAAAAAAAVVGLTQSAATNARELRNMAAVSNTTTQEFQKMAFGAKQVGIESDKLADILKDMNDRVGDFVATGAGPMVDFFEQIAPKVGVTADQFANLSGPQALQLYVDSLEKANVSQQEMTFYMEAIAGDSARLIPLLRDSGKGFAEAARQAEDLGIILSDLDLARLEDFDTQTRRITAGLEGMKNIIGVELSSVLAEVGERFFDAATAGEGFRVTVQNAIRGSIEGFGTFLDVIHSVRIALAGMRAFAASIGQAYTTVFEQIASALTSVLDFIAGGLNQVIAQVNKIPGVTDLALIDSFENSGYMRGARNARAEMAEIAEGMRADFVELVNAEMPSEGVARFLDDVDERVSNFRQNFQDQGGLFGQGGGFGPRNEEGGGSASGGDGEEGAGRFMGGLGIFGEEENQAFIEQLRAQQEARQDVLREYDELDAERQQEKFDADMERLREALELRAITEDEYRRAALEREREFAADKFGIRQDSESGITALVDRFNNEQVSSYATAFDSILASMSTYSETAFKIQKGLAIANAVIKGYEAAVGAYAWGANIGGPPLGAAMAAAAVAATGAQIAAIRSQQFSAGSASGGGSGGAASSAGGGAAQAQASQAQQQQEENRVTTINIAGLDDGAMLSGKQVRRLMEQINEESDNGMRLRFN